jgi:hypothetical protein
LIKVLLPLVLIIVVLGGVIFYLNSRGPFTIDCGSLDPATCEELWRAVAAEEEGLGALLPVTRVRITADHVGEPAECADVYIERFIFGTLVINDCL